MTGTLAALFCALCWAIAARLFRTLGQVFSPLALNFWKGVTSIGLLLLVTLIFVPMPELSPTLVFWLLLSGAIGIGIGDTFFFLALNKIGDNQSILIAETLAPILTGILGILWLAEWLSWTQWLGIGIVILSVDLVIKANQSGEQSKVFAPSGYLFAAVAALCQALGAVISRDILLNNDIDPFNASLLRLVGGVLLVIVILLVMKKRFLPVSNTPLKKWALFFVATFVGTFLALSLQMIAFSKIEAAVVQTLFGISVIFSLMIAFLLGEKIRKKAMLWSTVAVVGVALLLLGG